MNITNDFNFINGINTLNTLIDTNKNTNQDTNQGTEVKASGVVFKDLYDAFVKMNEDVNSYQNKASEIQAAFATGKTDDMLAVMLAQEEANTSLNFAVQVTNRIVSTYKEIMSIQI